eukprot:TRINITY_DN3271_c1_g4_i1.p1 TRINITY_DN3271_c1_g4~~TRINITY_DN3271_c1_g4_i1.p1  ORF type:complete len:393 (+),score=108.17 TRINITY_DN3271_c1_g4_i1:283-1461(+)
MVRAAAVRSQRRGVARGRRTVIEALSHLCNDCDEQYGRAGEAVSRPPAISVPPQRPPCPVRTQSSGSLTSSGGRRSPKRASTSGPRIPVTAGFYAALLPKTGLEKETWVPGEWASVARGEEELRDAVGRCGSLQWAEGAERYAGCRGRVCSVEDGGRVVELLFGDGRQVWLPRECLRSAKQSRGGCAVVGSRSVRYLLVRHGETEWNRDGRLQGQFDTTLTDEGRVQAAAVAEALASADFSVVLTSPLLRARETAAAIHSKHPAAVWVEDDRLKEMHLGFAQGHLPTSPRVARYLQARKSSPGDRWIGGGESEAEVATRAVAALEEAGRYADNVAVCTHSGVIAALVKQAGTGSCGKVRNCSVTVLVHNTAAGEWHVEELPATSNGIEPAAA